MELKMVKQGKDGVMSVFEYDSDLKIATFTGVDGMGNMCREEEAHDIHSIEQGLQIWGLFQGDFE